MNASSGNPDTERMSAGRSLVAWLKRPRRLPRYWQLLTIIGVGALVRWASLTAESMLPLFTHHRLDILVFHEAAQRFARGDVSLGDGVLHMSPGYTYFLGAVYASLGSGPWPIRVVQVLLGLATIAFIHCTVHTVLGRRWAIGGAAIAALYGPFVFYESTLLTASLDTCLAALTMWLAVRAAARGPNARWGPWLLVGLAWGAAATVRPTALLFGIPLVVAGWMALRPVRVRNRIGVLGAMACSAALVIAPVTARNYFVGGEFVLLTDSGGLNFYIGNGPGAIGTFRIPAALPDATNAPAQFAAFRAAAEAEQGRPLTSSEVNRHWYRKTWEGIRANPGEWVCLLAEKSWLFWSARELPNNRDYNFHRVINPVLELPFVQFSWIGPPALVGTILLLRRRRPAEWIVGGLIIVQFLTLVAFFVIARYRLPAVPALVVAALATVHWVNRQWHARRWAALVPALAGVALAAVLSLWPKIPKPFDDEYFRLGYAYHVQGDLASAERAYLKALSINHANLSARKNLARLYERVGDIGEAQAQWVQVGVIARKLGRHDYVRLSQDELARWGLRLQESDGRVIP